MSYKGYFEEVLYSVLYLQRVKTDGKVLLLTTYIFFSPLSAML